MSQPQEILLPPDYLSTRQLTANMNGYQSTQRYLLSSIPVFVHEGILHSFAMMHGLRRSDSLHQNESLPIKSSNSSLNAIRLVSSLSSDTGFVSKSLKEEAGYAC